eukprot:SAG31_NODE_69_length_28130_cov_15.318219_19_plen_349_part_00
MNFTRFGNNPAEHASASAHHHFHQLISLDVFLKWCSGDLVEPSGLQRVAPPVPTTALAWRILQEAVDRAEGPKSIPCTLANGELIYKEKLWCQYKAEVMRPTYIFTTPTAPFLLATAPASFDNTCILRDGYGKNKLLSPGADIHVLQRRVLPNGDLVAQVTIGRDKSLMNRHVFYLSNDRTEDAILHGRPINIPGKRGGMGPSMEQAGPYPAAIGWIVARKANGTLILGDNRADKVYGLESGLAEFIREEQIDLGIGSYDYRTGCYASDRVVPEDIHVPHLIELLAREFRKVWQLRRFWAPLLPVCGVIGMSEFARLVDVVWRSSGVYVSDYLVRWRPWPFDVATGFC